jgi:hypothetical protein
MLPAPLSKIHENEQLTAHLAVDYRWHDENQYRRLVIEMNSLHYL